MSDQAEETNGSPEPSRVEAAETTALLDLPNTTQVFKPTNSYATKKTIAQGVLDVALLLANASQMTALLEVPDNKRRPYFTALLVLISISIFLQLVTGVVLLILGFSRPTTEAGQKRMERLNNGTVILVFLITVVNVFITAFGITYVTENPKP